jgi:hypothetical protein
MAANIPLVALQGGEWKPPDTPLEAYSRVAQLQSQQQQVQAQQLENQQSQMAMKDQAAQTKAMLGWDGKSYNELAQSVLQNGGSAQAVQAVQKHGLDLQKSASEIAAHDAETGSKHLDTIVKQHDMALGALQTAEQVPDEQLPQHILETTKSLASQGMLDPPLIIQAQKLAQSGLPPDQMRQQLKLFEKNLQGSKEQFTQAQEERKTKAAEQTAQAREDAANKPASGEQNFQAYYKNMLSAKGVQPSAAIEFAARQQFQKEQHPLDAQRVQIAQENTDLRKQALEQSGQKVDTKDRDFIDKNYVKPANDKEQSYQMFQDAYNNRNNAKTGAESMLALSTHLATTFGNVKGARVTKDMIEHHLGARGITDSALVAVQKLTNGDVLSPDQWDAFKGLISQSRNLTWGTAQKEAKRRGVDITGSLPDDLKPAPAGTFDFNKFPKHQ